MMNPAVSLMRSLKQAASGSSLQVARFLQKKIFWIFTPMQRERDYLSPCLQMASSLLQRLQTIWLIGVPFAWRLLFMVAQRKLMNVSQAFQVPLTDACEGFVFSWRGISHLNLRRW